MRNIEVKVLNPQAITEARRMAGCAARLTQHGHNIKSLDDFMEVYNKPVSDKFMGSLMDLPHPTLQKFEKINVVVVGASRRFLAQITRHQNEVKFMSASLQYSDYSGEADFTIPYELLEKPELKNKYLRNCQNAMSDYMELVNAGVNNDTAGYEAPQGLRNVLIISATPYQFKHMISQRVCRRNTAETRYVMLRIWEQLYDLDPIFFKCGPFCMFGPCKEGKMCCGTPLKAEMTPIEILAEDFPLLMRNTKIKENDSYEII